MTLLYLKAAHIVFVVTWFAGLFYIVRLFVYLAETQQRPEAERVVLLPQLKQMARRLWFGITWPSAIVTCVLGVWLSSWYMPPPVWLQVKFGLIAVLLAYHGVCHGMHARLQRDEHALTPRGFRIWNEVATLLLVAIVFLVVLKDTVDMLVGIAGLVVLAAGLMSGITIYGRIRQSGSAND